MSTEPEPNPSATPASGAGEPPKNQDAAAKEAAAKALSQAKDRMAAGVANFKKLDVQTQVYLAGLAVAVLFGMIFSAVSISVKMDGPMADLMKQQMNALPAAPSVINASTNGRLAILAAIAGIGIWIWNFMAAKKQAWVPLALAGCAGFSALLFLVLWIRSNGSSVDAGIVKVSASMALLGFWVPFAGAIAAAVVSVKRILNPAPATAA